MKSGLEVGKVVQHPAVPPQLLAQRGAERNRMLAGFHLGLQGSCGSEVHMPVVPPGDNLVSLGDDGFRSSAGQVAKLLDGRMLCPQVQELVTVGRLIEPRR